MYKIENTTFFNSLDDQAQKDILELIQELNSNGFKPYTRIGNNQLRTLELDKIFKESAIFRKYVSKRKGMRLVIAKTLGITKAYLTLRVDILNLNLRLVDYYYSKLIKIFDIQYIVHFPKEKQLEIANDFVKSGMGDKDKYTRIGFFKRYTDIKRSRKRPMWKSKNSPDKTIKLVSPIRKVNTIDRWRLDDEEGHRMATDPLNIEKKKKRGPLCGIEGCDNGGIHLPVVISKKPKTEKEYYENLEMIVPADMVIEQEGVIDDWKKKNGY